MLVKSQQNLKKLQHLAKFIQLDYFVDPKETLKFSEPFEAGNKEAHSPSPEPEPRLPLFGY